MCPAVAVNSKLEYDVVEVESLNEHDSSSGDTKKKRLGIVLKDEKKLFLIVASELVPTLEAKWGVKLVFKRRLLGSDLENYRLIWMYQNEQLFSSFFILPLLFVSVTMCLKLLLFTYGA